MLNTDQGLESSRYEYVLVRNKKRKSRSHSRTQIQPTRKHRPRRDSSLLNPKSYNIQDYLPTKCPQPKLSVPTAVQFHAPQLDISKFMPSPRLNDLEPKVAPNPRYIQASKENYTTSFLGKQYTSLQENHTTSCKPYSPKPQYNNSSKENWNLNITKKIPTLQLEKTKLVLPQQIQKERLKNLARINSTMSSMEDIPMYSADSKRETQNDAFIVGSSSRNSIEDQMIMITTYRAYEERQMDITRTSGVNIVPSQICQNTTSNNTFDNSVRIEICTCIAAGLVNSHLPTCKPITAMVSSFMESGKQGRKLGVLEAVIKIQRAVRSYLSKQQNTLSLTLTTEDLISKGDTGFLKNIEFNDTEDYDAPLSVRDLLHGLNDCLST